MHYKLDLDDFLDEEFDLIAVHCSEEDYRLAYLLNRHLKMSFARTRNDLDFTKKGKEFKYSLYEFYDQSNHILYHLITNVAESHEGDEHVENSGPLFASGTSRQYLVPEVKSDFLIKVTSEGGKIQLKELVSKINAVKQVISAYSVDTDMLKSRNNLIF